MRAIFAHIAVNAEVAFWCMERTIGLPYSWSPANPESARSLESNAEASNLSRKLICTARLASCPFCTELQSTPDLL